MPASRLDFSVTVAGLKELIEGFRELASGELDKVIEKSANKTLRSVVVPAMRRQLASDFQGKGSHPGVTPKRGQSGPAERNVTIRKGRKRSGEVYALSVAPRAWYAHFPIAGTKPHIITARGLSARQVRSLNRGTGSMALRFGSTLVAQVHHPGSQGTDSVRKAVQNVIPQLDARFVSDLEATYDKHLTQPTRRARPRRT